MKRKAIAVGRKNRQTKKSDMRYTERHIEMMRNQFVLPKSERNLKILDIMMRHLRFLKRHDMDVRQQIYRFGEFVEYPPQTILFEKGD